MLERTRARACVCVCVCVWLCARAGGWTQENLRSCGVIKLVLVSAAHTPSVRLSGTEVREKTEAATPPAATQRRNATPRHATPRHAPPPRHPPRTTPSHAPQLTMIDLTSSKKGFPGLACRCLDGGRATRMVAGRQRWLGGGGADMCVAGGRECKHASRNAHVSCGRSIGQPSYARNDSWGTSDGERHGEGTHERDLLKTTPSEKSHVKGPGEGTHEGATQGAQQRGQSTANAGDPATDEGRQQTPRTQRYRETERQGGSETTRRRDGEKDKTKDRRTERVKTQHEATQAANSGEDDGPRR